MPTVRLGLTGGIGSGKSTVASMFSQRQMPVIDADAISRQCTSPQGTAMAAIQSRFGDGVVAPDGGLDRNAMRKLAFSDSSARLALQDIVHPLVGQEIARQTVLAEISNAACVVIDIPLLTESAHWRQRLDLVLVVDCSEDMQIARVMARDQIDAATVHRIMQTQSSRVHRAKCADIVIHNEDIELDELDLQVAAIAQRFGL